MKISYAKLQKKYSGMYVLSDKPDGKVVAASRNLGKAFKEAEKKGYKLPVVQYVEPEGTIAIYEVKISLRK
ncbi:hypothetical protein A3I53_01330 [Candidatus Curtissbacteria bacterium RIFCSPLOWO2_02_FULL_40_13b]|uniref:DUF5678 domain-containing protein n=3 Tax=Candidatus Curtissiibacteriota TaxID=1752717 RepID=A0A1F5HPV0_9BACT|nr:MAG: hypothetical protein A2693_03155 [Candidatus Curtissbacteria bacterium RIFCSPHIGHO2_01_FULL_40_12]OGE03327.1 MAG: hypothetical protein A3F45_03260 [Candidatus Curtissbacteria bacterium RIFCSPHIGHO2_12_FULL_41_17]OGE06085.1 MAG: hypothetical protein A3I53_01330 [Candidatus Curtissbacteria bacterium RIFCSPLOWO2_02_FULL_40_13b]